MAINLGQRLGSYEVLSLLGKGGMGEVYRARDSKLKRDVAIKILPDEFSRDPERVSRFQREAEVLASLNHPNIAAIYDLDEAEGTRFLVLELVEGPTLSERVRRGPLPIDEALSIAKQICDGLEAAHEKSVIHRDLKLANIKITPEGKVKLLDFGLARIFQEPSNADLSDLPTQMSRSTPGVIVGTAAYMSPEQAKGESVDRRADIWAFGCVLYEMLAGRAVFEGKTFTELLGAVIHKDVVWTALPASTPSKIRNLLRRCLQKDRTLRLRDIGDARIELDELQKGVEVDAPVAPASTPRRERILWLSAVTILTLVAAVALVWTLRPLRTAPEMRLEINTPLTSDPVSMAISPDGQKIVFSATDQGRTQLWVRALNSVSARPLSGTDSAQYPFWSPDSRSVGFLADSQLKRIDIDGGSVQLIAIAGGNRGGTWNHDDVILFNRLAGGPILRAAATGGDPIAITRLQTPQEVSHRFAQFLPDGRHFIYYVQGAPQARGVYAGQLDGPEPRRLLDADAGAVYASSGHLLFVRQGTLFAQGFDPVRLELNGNPIRLAEQVTVNTAENLAAISASAAGPLVYRTGSPVGGQRQLVWFDRSGKEVGKAGDPDPGFGGPAISPDGSRVAVQRTVNGNTDVWLLDLGRGLLTRFTFDVAADLFPLWSPDGSHVAFTSNRNGTFDLYQKPATGAGAEELLVTGADAKVPMDWSLDGKFLLYRNSDPKTNFDLWALPMSGAREAQARQGAAVNNASPAQSASAIARSLNEGSQLVTDGDHKPFPVVRTNFEEREGQFSPDGKWIAYQSNESGRFEIYVQPFPGPGGKFQISTNGGAQVRWRHDGKELFYIALDGRLMAVPIQFASNGQAIEPGSPVPLFATHIGGAVRGFDRQEYIVSPDGQRFLMNTLTEETGSSPITVILNWKGKS